MPTDAVADWNPDRNPRKPAPIARVITNRIGTTKVVIDFSTEEVTTVGDPTPAEREEIVAWVCNQIGCGVKEHDAVYERLFRDQAAESSPVN